MIFYECYADESLLKYLGFTAKHLRGGHSNGRSRVSAKLRNTENSLALIDEDPGAPRDRYLEYVFGLNPLHSDKYCIATIDPKTRNKLIVLRPNLEAWSVALARDKNINLENYELVNNPKKLHDILRVERNDRKRKKFLEFIGDIESHPALEKLKELIN
jgi:hypothetical protein